MEIIMNKKEIGTWNHYGKIEVAGGERAVSKL